MHFLDVYIQESTLNNRDPNKTLDDYIPERKALLYSTQWISTLGFHYSKACFIPRNELQVVQTLDVYLKTSTALFSTKWIVIYSNLGCLGLR